MTSSMRMEENWSHMTEKILNLTVEIIYLLIGEDFPLLKSGGHMTITVPPCDSLKPERHNMQKILEVTQKMMELLTGEGLVYLEDSKDFFKDAMTENCQSFPFPDESSNGKPPERCPRPLYSHQDPTQEDLIIPHHHQCEDVMVIKVEGEVEETYVRDEQQFTEEEAGMTRTFIEEDTPTQISTVHGQDIRRSSEDRLMLSPDCEVEDKDIIQYSPGENSVTRDVHPEPGSVSGPSYSSSPEEPQTVRDGKVLQAEKRFSCPECGKCFRFHSSLQEHIKMHTGEKPYSCSECGKCFSRNYGLVVHQKSHTGEKPYSCSECGKGFVRKSDLERHQTSHRGEKPYSCSECGKRFSQKSNLSMHQNSHLGLKPYSCSECGKSFSRKFNFSIHQKFHARGKPFSCPECGKCFVTNSNLEKHQKNHQSEKPHSCSECGKCYLWKSELVRHQKSHTGKKPI